MSNEDRLAQLRAEIDALRKEAEELNKEYAGTDIPQAVLERFEEIEQVMSYNVEQVQALERFERITSPSTAQSRGRVTGQNQPTLAPVRQARFDHMGTLAQAVARSCQPGAGLDERLAKMAPTTWSSEGTGADGGFAVPPEFSSQIMEYVGEQSSLYNRVDKTNVNNHLYMPADEDPPWASTGPQGYWEGEVDLYSQSKVNIRMNGFKLNKLVVLCPVSDELLEDAAQLESYLRMTIAKRMRWKIDFAILQGTGVGMPLGILNAPAVKTVAAEGGQTADTVNSANIMKMYNGLYGDFRGNATWVFNQDVETQLFQMKITPGTLTDIPLWLPAGMYGSQFAEAPNGTLFGRPLIYHQACETLGDKGDAFFVDFSQYLIGQKTTGPRFDVSIHLYFDYGLSCFRATWRMAGQPKWGQTISARDGSATYSPYVTLAERA